MLELDAQARSSAPPERVWALLADVRTWPEWADFDEAEVESGTGIGEVRAFRRGRTRTRERVTVFDPPRALGYDLVSGIPIRDYHADVTLTQEDGGTHIRWHSTFRAKVPGTGRLIRRELQKFVADTAERLARAADSRT
jgi:carbon monoxide dehydrogenase subunit G